MYSSITNLGCIVSKRVSHEGLKVGYMQRVVPLNDLDSGWRFFSGKEDQQYADKAENFLVADIFAVLKIDNAILPYLNCETGSKFIRNNNGSFSQLLKK